MKKLFSTIYDAPAWLWRLLKNPFRNAQTSAYFLLLVGGGAAIVGYLQQYVYSEFLNILDNPIADFYANASAELISIAITVLIIERANRQQNERERKEELIFQMGSDEAVTAKAAARMLRYRYEEWLRDGSLKQAQLHMANLPNVDLSGANLEQANLEKSNLQSADLTGVNLVGANLQEADLVEANLIKANLADADLRQATLSKANLYRVELAGAKLTGANLSNCDLEDADLQHANLSSVNFSNSNLIEAKLMGANLTHADLSKASLWSSNLVGAYLRGAITEDIHEYWQFMDHNDEFLTALLPDGTQWTEDTDMGRFTDEKHPDYESTLQKIDAIREQLK